VSANKDTKKAKDDLLEDTIPASKLEHFAKTCFTLILTMGRIEAITLF
jgi:hypothetical protein